MTRSMKGCINKNYQSINRICYRCNNESHIRGDRHLCGGGGKGVSAGRPSSSDRPTPPSAGRSKAGIKARRKPAQSTTRQLSLTEEGERYSPYAGGLAGNGGGRERSAGDAHDAAGLLRVDAATPVMLHFLMPLVKPFRERYPEMTLSLVSSETFINLIERKVDVAIRAGTLTDSSLRARPLFTSYRKIVASPDYVARYGMPQHPSDLKQHHCLGFTEPVSLNTRRYPVAMASC